MALTSTDHHPNIEVQVTLKRRIRSATARQRDGAIWVSVPSHWSKKMQKEAVDTLVARLCKQDEANQHLALTARQSERRLTFESAADLACWIHELNQATLKAPLKGIRVGTAKFTRLACMNVRTRMMTVSRFSLVDVPESALRYLILHELAHCFVANHSKAFWAHVAKFCPDFRQQARVMQAIHHVNVADSATEELPAGLMMSRVVLFGPEGPQLPDIGKVKRIKQAPSISTLEPDTKMPSRRRAAAAAKDSDMMQLNLFRS